MNSAKLGMFIAGATLVGGMMGMSVISHAQDPINPPVRNGDRPMPGSMGGQDMGGMGGRMMMGPSMLHVSGNYVYVLRGNQILKLSVDDLRVVRQAELPAAQMPNNTARPGSASGTGSIR